MPVALMMNHGTGNAYKNINVAYGDVLPADLNSPTRDGYKFIGWFEDAAGRKSWKFDRYFKEPTTLYAGWIVEPDPTPSPTPLPTATPVPTVTATPTTDPAVTQGPDDIDTSVMTEFTMPDEIVVLYFDSEEQKYCTGTFSD